MSFLNIHFICLHVEYWWYAFLTVAVYFWIIVTMLTDAQPLVGPPAPSSSNDSLSWVSWLWPVLISLVWVQQSSRIILSCNFTCLIMTTIPSTTVTQNLITCVKGNMQWPHGEKVTIIMSSDGHMMKVEHYFWSSNLKSWTFSLSQHRKMTVFHLPWKFQLDSIISIPDVITMIHFDWVVECMY